MSFEQFLLWFRQTDARLNGQPPDLKLWWELKARLDAVMDSAPGAPADRHADAPAAVNHQPSSTLAPSSEIVKAPVDDEVEDVGPTGLTVYEEAVTLLRRRR